MKRTNYYNILSSISEKRAAISHIRFTYFIHLLHLNQIILNLSPSPKLPPTPHLISMLPFQPSLN